MLASIETYRQMFDELDEGIYFVNPDRVILYWSKGAERLSGFAAEEVVGRSCADNVLIHIDDKGRCLCKSGCPLQASIHDGQSRCNKVFMHHKQGHRVAVKVRTLPMRDETGQIVGGIETFTDVSDEAANPQMMRELISTAHTDPLTGTANRRSAQDQLDARMAEWQRHQMPFGVLMCDIDHFKSFNDRFGHATGDAVLKVVSRTLRTAIRPYDHLSRWGGEEFLVVVAHLDRGTIDPVAQRVRTLVEQSVVPDGDTRHKVTVSVGAAIIRPDDNVESLIARADVELYRAKRHGRNRVSIAA